jgi:hypothetical protein
MTGHEFDLVITVVSMLVLAGILAFLAKITIAVVPMAEAATCDGHTVQHDGGRCPGCPLCVAGLPHAAPECREVA